MTTAVPPSIADLVSTSALRGRALLLAQATDLDAEAHGAEQWLVVTERDIGVFDVTANGVDEPVLLRSFALNDLEGCRIATEVGCGYLQVKTRGLWVDLLRFSNRFAQEFQSVARRLERLCRDHEFVIDGTDGDEAEGLSEADQQRDAARKSVWRAFQLLRSHAWQVGIVAALSIVGVALELVPPWLQKDLVDRVLAPGQEADDRTALLGTLFVIVTILAVVRLTAAILSIAKSRLASGVGAKLTADLRSRMVQKLQRLSLSYHDHNQVGLLMSRVAYDTEALHAFVYHLSGGFVLQMLQMIAIGGMLFLLNPKLALYALLPSPLVLIATWIFCRYFYARQSRYWDAVGRQAVALSNLLSGIRVVKSFTQEDRETARFSTASEQLRDQRIQVDFATGTFSSIIGFLFALGGLLVWYVGGRDVLGDSMTLGSLMAFLSYLAMFYTPLTTISEGAAWISSFVAASQRIFDLLDTPEPKEAATCEPVKQPVRGQIDFDHVSFSYDGRQTVLHDFSVQLRPGEMVGIVGRSGSGKSTFVNLISRLYDVESGAIRIDGRNVNDFSSAELRRQVGVVLQEPLLFEGTVAANIAYGDPGAPPERIIESAKAAAAHDFILKLPFGYETPLGERGAGLSGGERQRISIARAILYDPRILILDEATSSIDTESERLIQQAVGRFAKGRTTLAIAHRLSTLQGADRILVIDQGRLAEQGTHRELLATDGIYAKLIRLQFGQMLDQSNHNGHALDWPKEAADRPKDQPVDFEVRWLAPGSVTLELGPAGELVLQTNGERFAGISVIRTFPATQGENYLSLRYVDEEGRPKEVGLIQHLAEWPQPVQELIRRALNRRYLLRVIERFQSIRDNRTTLDCAAETDDGLILFTVQNNPQSIKPFGEHGRLLTDVTSNHFLIPDVSQLTSWQRELLVTPEIKL